MPLLILIGLLALDPGCTIRPKPTTSSSASFDGNIQNSGMIELLPDGTARISEQARARYNGLAEIYGTRFIPAITANDGLTPGAVLEGKPTWIMTKQRLADWQTMSRWKRQGK